MTASSAITAPLGRFRADCRLCHASSLTTFLDLGMQPHSDGFLREQDLTEPEHFFPLVACQCRACGFTQLTYAVKPEFLYGESYVYDPSVTDTFRKHFAGLAASVKEREDLKAGGLAVDIGSNVGLLLGSFKELGLNVLGVDPAPRVAAIAKERGIETIVDFFSPAVAERIVTEKGKADIVTATNVFAHIDDLDAIMQGVGTLLAEKGVFVFEVNYLVDILERLLYDTFYHQHLSYHSIRPLREFFARFGMEIHDVERIPSHGGSIRVFVGKTDSRPIKPIVTELIALEGSSGAYDIARLERFARDVSSHRQALTRMLVELKDTGKTIVGIGAPAKGNTLLNFCGITRGLLEFVTDKSTLKQGLYTPGTHLPIKADADFLKLKPDYALILAWNFAPEIMRNLQAYKDGGGRFVVPIPSPILV